jgi:hypothetical protein
MDFHVLSVHTRDGDDGTPLQFISAEQLAYFKALEAALVVLLAALGALSATVNLVDQD